ncbi:MAG: hypothetical protein AAFO84_03650 [Cyanobacteria bacterium J06598_1]
MNAKWSQGQGSAVFADFDTLLPNLQKPNLQKPDLAADILQRIYDWTHGQPFLTRLIYQYLQKYSVQIVMSEGVRLVDEVVQQKILKNWQTNEAANHLNNIGQALLAHAEQDKLLILYMRILWQAELSASALAIPYAEQRVLCSSGLVRHEGDALRVANAIYQAVFDMAWIEQQVPGLTRTVSIVEFPAAESVAAESVAAGPVAAGPVVVDSAQDALSAASAIHLRGRRRRIKERLVACGVAVSSVLMLTAFLSANSDIQAFGQPVFTKPALSPYARPTAGAVATSSRLSLSNKALFDSGLEHATNGRWISMLHQFCRISPRSTYFIPAKRQLTRWIALYPETIDQANVGLRAKNHKTCVLMEAGLMESEPNATSNDTP